MEYRQFLQYVAKSKGVSSGALESAMELIAFHETGPGQRMNPGAKQKGGGPGNGLFMFEAGPGQGGITAVNRTVNHLINKLKIKLPEWLAKLYKKNALDASSLSADQQKYIFLGNYLEHPRADLSKLAGGDSAIADFWLKYHWAGPSSQKEQRLNSFLHSIKAAKGEQRVAVKENGLIINMQKLFENWRKFQNEATVGGRTLSSGETIGSQSVDEPESQPSTPEDRLRDVKIKPLVKVMDSFNVGPEQYSMIMSKFGDKSKTAEQHMQDFNSDNFDREYIKEIIRKLLASRDIGIDKDRITFSV